MKSRRHRVSHGIRRDERHFFFSSLRAFYHLTNFEFYPNNLADRVSVCWLVAGPGLGPRNWREPNKAQRRQRGENTREHIGSTELQTAHRNHHLEIDILLLHRGRKIISIIKLATLTSIISAISKSIFKILVPIMYQNS